MRLISIDPGSIRTGFAILDLKMVQPKYISSGVIITPTETTFAKRLLGLRDDFNDLILKHKPTALAIESLFFAKNAQSALKLGHARGVLITVAASNELPIFEYSPAEVKQSITGSGRASKQQVEQMVKLLLKLPHAHKFRFTDESDALAIGLAHAQTNFLKRKLNSDRTSHWKSSS